MAHLKDTCANHDAAVATPVHQLCQTGAQECAGPSLRASARAPRAGMRARAANRATGYTSEARRRRGAQSSTCAGLGCCGRRRRGGRATGAWTASTTPASPLNATFPSPTCPLPPAPPSEASTRSSNKNPRAGVARVHRSELLRSPPHPPTDPHTSPPWGGAAVREGARFPGGGAAGRPAGAGRRAAGSGRGPAAGHGGRGC
jgi:hypothetical protein